MARPRKRGLDYFPFDVDFFSDKKIKVLKGRYGADGILIYIYLLCEVYREGHYIKIDKDYEYIIAEDLCMSEEKVKQVVNFLLKRSLLESTLFESDNIITSQGIQRRFQEAVKSRASKSNIEVDRKYWLLGENETQPFIKFTQNSSFSEKNPSFSEKNPERTDSFSEKNDTKKSKEKKSKEKESISVSKDTVCRTDVQRIVDAWNSIPGIEKISRLTNESKRFKMLKSRINEYGVDEIFNAIKQVENSRFLLGDNKSGWTIDFEWFVRPNNFPKVLEGKYGDKAGKQASSKFTAINDFLNEGVD